MGVALDRQQVLLVECDGVALPVGEVNVAVGVVVGLAKTLLCIGVCSVKTDEREGSV